VGAQQRKLEGSLRERWKKQRGRVYGVLGPLAEENVDKQYVVAMISRLLKIIGLLCKRAL